MYRTFNPNLYQFKLKNDAFSKFPEAVFHTKSTKVPSKKCCDLIAYATLYLFHGR